MVRNHHDGYRYLFVTFFWHFQSTYFLHGSGLWKNQGMKIYNFLIFIETVLDIKTVRT